MRMSFCAAVPLLTAALPAAADTVTWQVPVNVHALMPEVSKVRVHCSALDGADKRLGSDHGASPALAPDAQGDVVTTTTVKQQLAPGMAKPAMGYTCSLFLTPPNGFEEWVGGTTT